MEEYLRVKRFSAVKEGYANMNMSEYQLTYFAFNLFLKKYLAAVTFIFELAQEIFLKFNIVNNR